MKTYNKLFDKVCSLENIELAFNKAKKGKSKKPYVKIFESDLQNNISTLKKELKEQTYFPYRLKKFIIRDPKTRTIHSSIFRDRIVHHAIINIIEPIFEKIFIFDSFASRKNKGTHEAIKRFDYFKRKVFNGYVLKADFRKYFDTINHEILLKILRKKINDGKLIDLINKILKNHGEIGMPLGNYTSQFLANVYLNEFDYYIKHVLKAKYYIRYVDDFVILHSNKKRLEYFMEHIKRFLPCLKIQLHPEKSKIIPLRNGINFLGYRIFFHYRLLRQRNIKTFKRKLDINLELYKNKEIRKERLNCRIQGWLGHAKFANTYNLRKKILPKDLNRGLG